MTPAPAPFDTIEEELDAERDNGDRLHAALSTALAMMHEGELDALRAVLVCPRASQLSVGHVLDGALALHEALNARRPQ